MKIDLDFNGREYERLELVCQGEGRGRRTSDY